MKIIEIAIATTYLLSGYTVHPDALPTVKQSSTDIDNIYHEDEHLPDDADLFPRMGKTEGDSQARNNCRTTPWGQVATTFVGNVFIEIDDRTIDRNGESWFHNPDSNCWIHDSRIDLL